MNWKKRKKLNRLAKKHGLIHGYEYKSFIRKMDLTSVKHDTPDDYINTFRKKLQDEIQRMMNGLIIIHPVMELSHLPHPLPPFKPDDINLEKLEWIFPPILVKPEDECRKEIHNDIRNQKE